MRYLQITPETNEIVRKGAREKKINYVNVPFISEECYVRLGSGNGCPHIHDVELGPKQDDGVHGLLIFGGSVPLRSIVTFNN